MGMTVTVAPHVPHQAARPSMRGRTNEPEFYAHERAQAVRVSPISPRLLRPRLTAH
jgi:hypothetical protein